jgi:WbqC-like protein
MIVTCHQCNFFPYEGVIAKAQRADVFVALTHVQFTRNNYHNRFALQGVWHTLSVNQRLEPLVDKVYRQPQVDWLAIKRRLPAYHAQLERFDDLISPRLVDTNLAIIRRLFLALGITARVELDYPTELMRTERLVDLCRYYNAKQYLSGPSGHEYLDVGLFERQGIEVVYQEPPLTRRAAIELLKDE